MTKAQAIARLWQLGNLSYKLDSNQKTIYDQIKNSEDMFVTLACSRGMGKSYFMCLIAMEVCLRKPNIIVKYLAPTIKDLKNVVIPNYKLIIDDCPKEMLPTYNKADGKIIFHNGSEIHLAGTENGNAEKVRGSSAELCLVDEAGFCDDLKYTVENILYPTLTRGGSTKGKKIILASTPSRSPDHDFITYMRDAEFKGKLIKRTVYDNPRLRETAIADGYTNFEEYVEKVVAAIYPDGVNSSAFKREYLCDIRIEDSDAVVPEFAQVEEEIVKEWPMPLHYDGYVSMDIGFTDLTVVLFAFYDFLSAKLIIVDELVLSGTQMLTDNLAYQVNEKELKNYPSPVAGIKKEPFKRIADNNNPILLQDLSVKHGISFGATDKDNFEAALNNMRILIKTKKVIINPRCTTLIKHLKGAIWNKQRNNFKRDPSNGHYDACFTAGNRVFTRNGYKNIEDIVVGDEVLTHKNRFKPVLATMNKEYVGDLYKIKLSGQRDITCTPEHQFFSALTFKNRKDGYTGQLAISPPEWISAEKLSNTKIYSPYIEEETFNITKEMCFLYGYWVAEGSLGGNGHQISFAGHQKEVNVISILEKAVKETYGLGRPGTSKRSVRRHLKGESTPRTAKARVYNSKLHEGRTINITCEALYLELKKLGKSTEKKFPDFVSKLDQEQSLYMLSGYLFGDGHFSSAGVKSCTISLYINDSVDLLYRKLGISRRERLSNKNKTNLIYESSITKQESQKIIDLILSKEDLSFIFKDKLIHDLSIKYKINYDLLYKRVKVDKIEAKSVKVYNLEVAEDNSYVVNGAAVHNCSALIYLCRNVDFSRNPYPKDALLSNYHYTQEYLDNQKPATEFEKTMTKILKPKFGRFRR